MYVFTAILPVTIPALDIELSSNPPHTQTNLRN